MPRLTRARLIKIVKEADPRQKYIDLISKSLDGEGVMVVEERFFYKFS